jgi:hypothetical protein
VGDEQPTITHELVHAGLIALGVRRLGDKPGRHSPRQASPPRPDSHFTALAMQALGIFYLPVCNCA